MNIIELAKEAGFEGRVMNALDKLGLAIANAGYTWTPEMREAYENGVKEFEALQFALANAKAEALKENAKQIQYLKQIIFGFEQKLATRGYEIQIASLEESLKNVRAEALEEAAKVCEEYALESMEAFNRTGHDFEDGQVNGGYGCAAAIRSLCQKTDKGRLK